MHALQYHEAKQRGSKEFPLDYYYVDYRNPRYEMPYHWHEETEILYVRSGRFSLSLDGTILELQAGDAAYLPAESLHGGTPHNCVYECIVFDAHMLQTEALPYSELLSNLFTQKARVKTIFKADENIVSDTLQPLFETLRTREVGSVLKTIGFLYAFFGSVLSQGVYYSETGTANDSGKLTVLKKVFDYIAIRYSQKVKLQDLASLVHMESKYFCRFFKKATHMTPMEYLQYYRVEQACREMQATDKNVTEIALDVGFSSPEYFARVFRKYKGTAPRGYMEMMRGKSSIKI